MLDEYNELHSKFLKEFLEYHNAHISFIYSKQGRDKNDAVKRALRQLRETAKALNSELTAFKKKKSEYYKDHYQQQRKNKNGNEQSDENTI
jgi:hypothetical protein